MNDIKSAKRNKLQKPLFALMLIAMYGANFKFDYNKLAGRWLPRARTMID